MHKLRPAVALLLIAFSPLLQAGEADELANQARGLVKQFGGSLKGTLQASMKSDGPVAAIGTCNLEAPGIAESVGNEHGWQVGRTSLRTRNPDNQPDSWELDVLNTFEKRKAEGADAQTLEHYSIVETENGRVFRYMKAIPTAGVCLVCHGSDLAAPVAEKLQDLYPDDMATGFHEGDIRGAFTLSKALKP